VSNRRVLVVGTTADYIDIICRRFPERAAFLTDTRERAKATETPPDETAELQCDLADVQTCLVALRKHLDRWGIEASGIACFDCESLALAAHVARSLALPYALPEAVAVCRSKFASKQAWQRAGLPCPDVEAVRTIADAAGFLERIKSPAVLKPLTGSGSELTFLVRNRDDCSKAFHTLKSRLAQHPDVRMYSSGAGEDHEFDPRLVFVAEEYIPGTEYSCDFLLDGDRVEIVRIAKKIPASGQTFGTILAYVLPAELPPGFEPGDFRSQLHEAARALGLQRAICMLDFIVQGSRAVMLEMTPRPGGDCLPPLILRSCGLDMLGCALDFAEGRPVTVPQSSRWRRLVGLRLFATRPGVIRRLDLSSLSADRRVVECHLKRAPGHRVVLPPEDYDSRLLGHVIFEASDPADVETECVQVSAKLLVEMETS